MVFSRFLQLCTQPYIKQGNFCMIYMYIVLRMYVCNVKIIVVLLVNVCVVLACYTYVLIVLLL